MYSNVVFLHSFLKHFCLEALAARSSSATVHIFKLDNAMAAEVDEKENASPALEPQPDPKWPGNQPSDLSDTATSIYMYNIYNYNPFGLLEQQVVT